MAAAVAATIFAERNNGDCPGGGLLCDGGANCTHQSSTSPRSPRAPAVLRSSYSEDFTDSLEDSDELRMNTRSRLVRGDGVITSDEALEDGGQDADKEVIQELYQKVKKSKAHIDSYIALLGFILLSVLYLMILLLQADSFKTFQVSTAHMSLLPEGLTGEGGFSFSDTSQIYDWLNDSIVQKIWVDADCGNGICERPDEFQAFGRFGCPSDCGFSPNVSSITINLMTSFSSESEMLASNWNLCMEYPTFLCWYEEAVVFEQLLGTTIVPLEIPDGNWTLLVNAPFGGVVGSVVYNSTYAWETPDAIIQGASLVSWSNCAANESDTPLEFCRQLAGTITMCAKDLCTIRGLSLQGAPPRTALFVDLVGLCNIDFSALDEFDGMDCEKIVDRINNTNNKAFESLQCNTPSEAPLSDTPAGRRRLLEDSSSLSFPTHSHHALSRPDLASTLLLPERRKTLAELDSNPDQFTNTLWNKLGATEAQRFYNLRAATHRALYAWVGHSCLAHIPLPVTVVDVVSAFFCVYFGGPIGEQGCVFRSSSTNEVLTNDSAIAYAMKVSHARFNITREQENAFIDVFLLALRSVFTVEESTVVAFSDRLHALDTEIVDSTKAGCPHVASTLPWTVGQSHYTEISKGDLVTWVWEDDEPHSIKVDDGLGENVDDPFKGYGAGRLIVSRNSICKPDNIGPGNMSNDPLPCVLQEPGTTFNTFSYTKVFNEVGQYNYTDGRNEETRGVVVVTDTSITNRLSIGSLAQECSPGCTLGVVRNGICNSVCNYIECAFDGGDCTCAPNQSGVASCTCPAGQTRAADGSCCQAYGVGSDRNFRFAISTWGPNVIETDDNFLPSRGPPLFRYVAVHNRVLVGMSIKQKRWASRPCKDGRFFDLFPNCTHGASIANYGVNPVFLPRSVLFNEAFAQNDTSYYANNSLAFNNETFRNQQGIPFGFEAFSYEQPRPTFHYILDLNFNNEQAEESLRYMRDGFFIDNATKEVTVQLITYNGVVNKFTLFEVSLTFQTGGKIAATYDIQSITAEPYRTSLDWFRLCLELVFVLCVCWNIYEEGKELWEAKKYNGSYLSHFASMWNFIDLISLSIMTAAIIMWINFLVTEALPFKIQLRYPIYDIVSWQSPGQYWKIVPPGNGFADALAAFSDIQAMTYFRTYYVALNGINVLLMVLRILKLMDFQPRMGTITRTVAAAAPDLVHFFILFSIVFIGFATYGHLVFGRTLDQFRSLPIALVTCFSAMLGNDTTNDFLMQLQGWDLVAAVIFWWSYILIMVFIIFNLLIAIVVEAFIKVREEMEDAPSMPSEVLWIVRHMGRRMFTPLRTDKELLRHLRALGAKKAAGGASSSSLVDGEESLGGSTRKVQEPHSPKLVLQVNDREMDLETLEAIFKRADRHKRENKKLRTKVEPEVIAEVVFNQFREESSHKELKTRSETEDIILNIENMKSDMEAVKSDIAEMKDLMKSMLAAMSTKQP